MGTKPDLVSSGLLVDASYLGPLRGYILAKQDRQNERCSVDQRVTGLRGKSTLPPKSSTSSML